MDILLTLLWLYVGIAYGYIVLFGVCFIIYILLLAYEKDLLGLRNDKEEEEL